MEFWLLVKLGIAINTAINAGYAVAGGYLIRIGYQYYTDYKEAISRENGVR